jgi:hypothetical protein
MKASYTLSVILVLALLGTAALGASDFDFGGSLDNSSTPSVTLNTAGSSVAMDQRNKAAVWIDTHFGASFSLSVEGSYSFSLPVPLLLDIDYLRADWQMLPSLKLTAGRFMFSDFTGHVLNHKLDGVMLTASAATAVVTASVGFSGLLLKPYSLILMSRSDSADQSNADVYFAAPRLVEKLEAIMPNYMPRQDMSVSVILQQDLRAANTLIQPGEILPAVAGRPGGGLSSQYVGIGFSGAAAPSLYYDTFFYLNLGSTLSYLTILGSWEYAPIVASLTGFSLRYFMEDFLSSRVELQAIYSSGDGDNASYQEGNTAGASTDFVPISEDTLGLAFQPQWGNMVLVDASFSLKPFSKSLTVLQNLQLVMKVLGFFRPTTGGISQAGLNPASADLYLGTEVDGIVNFRPLSDLGLALSIGFFAPNPGAFVGPAAQPVLAVRAEVSFSF